MFATIVLDIPDLNHQGFDYKIPESMKESLKIGCRVLVPLGPRVTQGFVIEIKDSTDLESIKLVKENLDLIPSLTNEMIDLGRWMSKYYSSHLFRTLQMLLPSALKTKVKEQIIIKKDVTKNLYTENEMEIINWIEKKQPVSLNLLLNNFYSEYQLIMEMLKSGILVTNRDYKDKVARKKVSYIKIKQSSEDLLDQVNQFSKQAIKQKQILEYFIVNEIKEVELSILINELNINRSSIQGLIKKDIVEVFEREVDRDPYKEHDFIDKKIILNDEQATVLQRIIEGYKRNETKPFLLHGVTGSGKTEVYLGTIEYILKNNKDAIILVPEISLTPQMVERFKGRFGSLVAVLHSRLSQGEKLDEWRRIQRGEAKIAIGARSAIFAPFNKLGLIVIDEEHESSYKQEEHPKYHVRDIAKWRADYYKAVVVLGSATPSMESYYNSLNNNYQLLEMPNRVMGRPMPTIHIVDMRDELRIGNRSMFSSQLQKKIEERLLKNEQIVLFLNRRGYSTFIMCRSCGYVIKCPHCEISLTYHQNNRVLRCHYCGHIEAEPKSCPECGSNHIRYFGTGTQKVEEELAKRFPGVRVIRMDVDTTGKKGAHEKLLTSFRRQEADILLGTQMIAKGLDFPKVTLVGVIAADTLLKLPDFRASEKTFQLLTQVSGRAGRHQLKGDVVIQTYSPEHYSIEYASNHDYKTFFNEELKQRRILNYPPHKKLVLINFSHPDLSKVMRASEMFVRGLRGEIKSDIEILGPVASPISRLKDRYRFQCMIKYSNDLIVINNINYQLSLLINELKDRQLLISVDVDPYVLM